MSDVDLTRARELADHAQPGPWRTADTVPDKSIRTETGWEVPCGSCDGQRWVDDENWQPDPDDIRDRIPIVRTPGNGRIPCGGCNHGGWNEPDGHLWPCGCLINRADAHRVGCPEHPEGVKP